MLPAEQVPVMVSQVPDASRQSLSPEQVVSPVAKVPDVQLPVLVSQVPNTSGIWHVTKFALPQIDFAAQRVTFPLQLVGSRAGSLLDSMFTCLATQLT